jgi:hypothetical protein
MRHVGLPGRLAGLVWLTMGVLTANAAFSCVATGNPNGQNGGRARTAGDGGSQVSGNDSGVCASSVCAPLECGPGTRAMPLPGECCPTLCEPSDCSTVDCPPFDCVSGTHPEKPNGLCCTACVKNPAPKRGETCGQGQAGYADYLDQTMSALGAALCNADSDCRIIVIDNPCDHGCGTAVAFRTANELKSRLSTYASAHCAACEQAGPGCPPVERFPYCTGGVCSAH